MQFNYNIKPVDFGAYFRGLESYDDRQANQFNMQQAQQASAQQQQVQELAKRAMAGDKQALNELAAIDPTKASQLLKVQQSQQPAKPTQVDFSALGGELSQIKGLAANGSPMLDSALQNLASKYQGTGFETEIANWGQKYQQDPQAAMQELDASVNAFSEPAQPKTGRYVRERMGDELAIIDSATGSIVKKYAIPQSRKEQADLAKKTADIKKAETEAQLKAITADSEEEKVQASIEMASEASALAKELANDENLGQAVGTLSTQLPTFRESTQDIINKAQRLESLLTVDNLKLMSGVLTDRDIAFLTRVASGLNISDGGIKGSESAVRKRLIEIANKIDSLMPSQQPAQNAQPAQPASQSGAINWSDL